MTDQCTVRPGQIHCSHWHSGDECCQCGEHKASQTALVLVGDQSTDTSTLARQLQRLDDVMAPATTEVKEFKLNPIFPLMAAMAVDTFDITTFTTKKLETELECRQREGKIYYKALKYTNIGTLRLELNRRKMKEK